MHRHLRLIIAVVLGLLVLVVPEARAQMGAIRALAGGMTTPNVNARQLKLYAQVLQLSPDQTKAAEDLLASYETDYLAAIKRFQEIQQAANQEFMQTGDMELVQSAMQDAMKKFAKRAEKLETSLMTDIKTVLDPAQLERWPEIERLHRRMTTVNWGSLSGESIDLFDLVDGLRLPAAQTTAITPLLAQYELDLDRELTSRNAIIQEQLKDWYEGGFMNYTPERIERMKKQASDLREAGKKILDLNKRYAGQIRPLLPEEQQKEFADRVKLAGHPIVYRRSYAQRILDAAAKLPDLESSQKEALQILQDTYTREASVASDAWAAAISEHELNPPDTNPFAQFMPQQLPEALKAAKDAREAIDTRTVDAVKALLTEQQRTKLPAKKDRADLDFDSVSTEK